MKPGGGKQKGASWEREICKILSTWITEGKREDVFWRSAMSGGRATVQAKKGITNRSQSGDISAVSEEGNLFCDAFCVEIKHYADLKLNSLLFGKPQKNSILDFWKQTQNQALVCRQEPMLIAKQNRCSTLLGVASSSKIGKWLSKTVESGVSTSGTYPGLGLSLYSFDEFIEKVDPIVLMFMYRKLEVVN